MNKIVKLANLISIYCLSLLLISCSAEKTSKNPAYLASKTEQKQLTDKDIFDDEFDKEITEYDIQDAAYQGKKGLFVPLNSSIILVQSGATVPDAYMQSELAKYYRVSVYNGIPNPKNLPSNRKNKDSSNYFNNNYMKKLRFIAAKGGQDTIIIYWKTLEKGTLDQKTNTIKWNQYNGDNLTNNTKLLRYLLKFTLVDVVTGNWSTYSPVNIEVDYIIPKKSTIPTEQFQIDQLIQKTYTNAALLLAERYKIKSK